MHAFTNKTFARRAGLALVAAAIALPALTTVGCSTRKQLRTAMEQREDQRQLAQQNEAVAYSARAEAQVYRAQLKANAADSRAKEEAIDEMTRQMVDLQQSYDRLNADFTEVSERANSPVPPQLAAELKAFAAANADFVDYDADTGLVRFKSDVTFGAGSAVMTPQAASAVKKLASIFNSSSANSFDLMVAGHTDSKPVSRASTIQKGHKDNWYLSSHRAIAVSEALRAAGVSGNRVAVVGYADKRPVATNATAAGRASNRRVEILVVAAAPTAGKFTTAEAPATKSDEGNAFNWFNFEDGKDATASTPQGPVFEK